VTALAERYEGKRFNSPNDAVVRSDGTVFFTDPPYGLEDREAELPYSGVYALAPDGTVRLLAKDFDRPNGIALSPDGKILYVADTARSHVRAFDLDEAGQASNGRVLCEVPGPDGMKVDSLGRLWCTSDVGVRVFAPDGKPLGVVETPQPPANCGFGDEDARTLYITARTAVYKVRCVEPGLRP
jgi:sugar lactone lactonase YvrE